MAPDLKMLKKLAAACRKAGIKTYKSGDLEFTLTEDAPTNYKPTTKNSITTTDSGASSFQTDTLTEEQLLMWSTGAVDESKSDQ